MHMYTCCLNGEGMRKMNYCGPNTDYYAKRFEQNAMPMSPAEHVCIDHDAGYAEAAKKMERNKTWGDFLRRLEDCDAYDKVFMETNKMQRVKANRGGKDSNTCCELLVSYLFIGAKRVFYNKPLIFFLNLCVRDKDDDASENVHRDDDDIERAQKSREETQ